MDGMPTTSAPRSAVQKRAHQQAVAEAVAGYNVLYGEEAEEAAEQDDGFLMADEGRFEEVGNHLIEDAVLPQSLDDLEVLPQEHPETFAIGTQVGSSVSMRFAKAVQVNIVTGSRNKGSQTTSCTGDIGCQAEPEVREIAIQTDLFDIDVPVFRGLKPSDEDMEDEEVHFPSQETMKTDDSDDEDWEPCEDDYCQEFDDSLLDDENVLLLATLHFNENSNRKQRMGQDEQPQWSISYPKGRGGAAVAKEVKIESTYDYVQLILEDLLKRRDDLPSYKLARDAKDKYQVTHPIPGPVCSKYDKQDKMKVVDETKTRFIKL
ncbi:uncharacterized protein LOC135497330 [Lineus longissimus]|uniref:uncharacterized protein LOC135497330 n=1 Tax=Lineus longissimus TaxID=88925 RepID=UPI00315DB53B